MSDKGDEIILGPVVDALCSLENRPASRRGAAQRQLLPSRDALIDILGSLRSVLFPGYFSDWDLSQESLHFYVGATLDRVLHVLQEQIRRGLCFAMEEPCAESGDAQERAHEITREFLRRLPALRERLDTDVQAHYDGDPAATTRGEIVYSYPGLRAIMHYRLAHELHALGVPLIPRIITEHAHALTGVDIHPGATIGERFFIDHGTGVVIGETSVIGRNVCIYQGVTLGAKSFPKDEKGNPVKGIPRHPIVEDGVIIYSGATILGRVTIGKGAVVGGNVWLTRDVAPGTMVTQGQSRQVVFEGGGGI
ncbi:MAG: serine acetyltransferase [Deltaproteobacteria bacterium]|nr:serine acetyltransferase [Deltaproteobacteria bacterium]